MQKPCGGRKHGRCEELDEGLTKVQRQEESVHDGRRGRWGQRAQGLEDHMSDLGLQPQSTSYPSEDLNRE